MNKIKSTLATIALGVVASTSFGCYTDNDRDSEIYEPSGASREDAYGEDDFYEGEQDYKGRYDDERRREWERERDFYRGR